jgi:hypothetical protein
VIVEAEPAHGEDAAATGRLLELVGGVVEDDSVPPLITSGEGGLRGEAAVREKNADPAPRSGGEGIVDRPARVAETEPHIADRVDLELSACPSSGSNQRGLAEERELVARRGGADAGALGATGRLRDAPRRR